MPCEAFQFQSSETSSRNRFGGTSYSFDYSVFDLGRIPAGFVSSAAPSRRVTGWWELACLCRNREEAVLFSRATACCGKSVIEAHACLLAAKRKTV